MAQYDIPVKTVENLEEIARYCFNFVHYKDQFEKYKDPKDEQLMVQNETNMRTWLANNLVKK